MDFINPIPISCVIPQDLAPQVPVSYPSISALSADDPKDELPDALSEKEWTVLSYVMHNNFNKMRQMKQVGTSQETNIVSSFSRQGPKGEERSYYLINKENTASYLAQDNSVLLKNLGSQDFGDPKTLEDFLVWGIENFPAKHFAVVMHNHGNIWLGGWRDFTTENMMTLPEIQQVFERVKEKTGIKPDIISMDACLMANLETAYQLKDSANILIGSEDLEFMQYGGAYAGMPLNKTLDVFPKSNDEMKLTAEEIASKWVKASTNDRGSPTMSALKLSEIGNIADKADELARTLLSSGISMEVLGEVVKKTKHFAEKGEIKPFIYQHDVYHFAKNLIEEPLVADKRVRKAAGDLCNAIKKAVIASQNSGAGEENAHGISVYLPHRKDGAEMPQKLLETSLGGRIRKNISYKDLAFAHKTHWDELFMKLAGSDRAPSQEVTGSAESGERLSAVDYDVPGSIFQDLPVSASGISIPFSSFMP